MLEVTSEAAAKADAERDALEASRESRASMAVVMNVIAALAPLAVAFVGVGAETLGQVEDAMGLSIGAIACAGPLWLISTVAAISSQRRRALGSSLLYPLAWGIALVLTT